MKQNIKNDIHLEEIWHQVPENYYQKGVKKNFLQRSWHLGKLKAVLELIDQENSEPISILDVGCASGWFLSEVSSRYPKAKCTGVDVYKKAINYGKKTYKNLRLIQADAHKLPFPEKSFDLIICTEVLEHVVNPKQVLKEIKRVLNPRGIAIVELDSGSILFRLIWFWWTNLRHGVWRDSHIHAFNLKKLKRLILDAGFHIKKEKTFNYSMAVAFSLTHKKITRVNNLKA